MQTDPDREDVALYIEKMSGELKRIAANAGLDFLSYMIAMVQDEAEATLRRLTSGDKDGGGRK